MQDVIKIAVYQNRVVDEHSHLTAGDDLSSSRPAWDYKIIYYDNLY